MLSRIVGVGQLLTFVTLLGLDRSSSAFTGLWVFIRSVIGAAALSLRFFSGTLSLLSSMKAPPSLDTYISGQLLDSAASLLFLRLFSVQTRRPHSPEQRVSDGRRGRLTSEFRGRKQAEVWDTRLKETEL